VIQVRNLRPALPVSAAAKAVAAGTHGAFLEDAQADGAHVRVITVPSADGTAVQVARPLSEVDTTLSRLRLVLLLVSLGGIAAAAVLGRTVARRALKPVEELTEAAEHVAHTRDLSRRMTAEGTDELSRLAASFNTMLEALDASQAAQRQLVADASHELRTPLTSLRTNLEVLARGDVLPPAERERLLRRATGQLEELSVLVGDLVDLARGAEAEAEPEVVRLDLLVEEAVDRARAHAPDAHFAVELSPTLVAGVPSRLHRAVSNLLDNAVKWSPRGEVIEVTTSGGEVAVRDHGPGIADDDLPFVFDRFYRATSARGLPGSGLGLAIVRQVAESHGGRAWAEHAPGGGARLCIALPVAREPVEPAQPLLPAVT
jgi:two-component system sensor histidine kinase MprB